MAGMVLHQDLPVMNIPPIAARVVSATANTTLQKCQETLSRVSSGEVTVGRLRGIHSTLQRLCDLFELVVGDEDICQSLAAIKVGERLEQQYFLLDILSTDLKTLGKYLENLKPDVSSIYHDDADVYAGVLSRYCEVLELVRKRNIV
jgi:hypothetical protein